MRQFSTSVSHHDSEVKELKADRELAVEYIKLAVRSLGDHEERLGGMLALSALCEAYGDLSGLAAEAGVADDQLFRSLPKSDIPRFATTAEYQIWIEQLQEAE